MFFVLSVVIAPVAFAHHLWVAEDEAGFFVARGHAPDKVEAYNPFAVKEVRAYDRNGNQVPVTKKDMKNRVSLKTGSDVSMITAKCDWGYRVNTTDGKKMMNRHQAEKAGLQIVSSFFSTQYTKSLFKDGGYVTKAVGLEFEIIPRKNPFKTVHGDTLPVQINFQGTPLANVSVFSGAGQELKSDDKGIVNVPLSKKGIQIIWASHKVPTKGNKEMDYRQYMTFVSFGISEK
jgi:nickel transport protein